LLKHSEKTDKKYLIKYVRTIIICAFVFALIRAQDWHQFFEVLKQIDFWIFITVLGMFFIGQIMTSLRWWLLIRGQNITITYLLTLKLHLLGFFYNNVLPSSVGGDLLRAWYAAKNTSLKLERI
jgi:hypothetical protein